MAAITASSANQISPNAGVMMKFVLCPATMDSADTVDVSAAANGGFTAVYFVAAYDVTTGDALTTTISGTTVTVDAAGGTTNHAVGMIVIGI